MGVQKRRGRGVCGGEGKEGFLEEERLGREGEDGWARVAAGAGPAPSRGLVRRGPREGGLGRSPEGLRVPGQPRSASPPPLLWYFQLCGFLIYLA